MSIRAWKLTSLILAALIVGYVIAVLTGAGTAFAQIGSGQVIKVQLDTSNCSYGVSSYPPSGSIVMQAEPTKYAGNTYVYNVCK